LYLNGRVEEAGRGDHSSKFQFKGRSPNIYRKREVMTTISENAISRDQIAATNQLIRPYIRRTPVIDIDGADFGLDSIYLSLKLELLQHSGSFKARGGLQEPADPRKFH
jgi:hypothetical protein